MEMNQETTFCYKYSVKKNKEMQEFRKKYLSQSEGRLDKLKQLDEKKQNLGTMEALCVGIGGLIVFGLGMCIAMQVIGSGVLATDFGIFLGIVGMVYMLVAYPIQRFIYHRNKETYVERILELTEEFFGKR